MYHLELYDEFWMSLTDVDLSRWGFSEHHHVVDSSSIALRRACRSLLSVTRERIGVNLHLALLKLQNVSCYDAKFVSFMQKHHSAMRSQLSRKNVAFILSTAICLFNAVLSQRFCSRCPQVAGYQWNQTVAVS